MLLPQSERQIHAWFQAKFLRSKSAQPRRTWTVRRVVLAWREQCAPTNCLQMLKWSSWGKKRPPKGETFGAALLHLGQERPPFVPATLVSWLRCSAPRIPWPRFEFIICCLACCCAREHLFQRGRQLTESNKHRIADAEPCETVLPWFSEVSARLSHMRIKGNVHSVTKRQLIIFEMVPPHLWFLVCSCRRAPVTRGPNGTPHMLEFAVNQECSGSDDRRKVRMWKLSGCFLSLAAHRL